MEFDFILACGDSFTEGCQERIGRGINGTWPGIVANHFGVPFANIATGGSSNTTIALQPVNTPHGNIQDGAWIDWSGIGDSKKPLIIFAFTIMDRWTYFHPEVGTIHSHYSIDPQYMEGINGNKWTAMQKHIPIDAFGGYSGKWLKTTTGKPYQVENFLWATIQAIMTAMQYQSLIPNATVLWGFIHEGSAYPFGKDITQLTTFEDDIVVDGVVWPSMDSCFNKWFDYKPLQRVLNEEDDIIGQGDRHPNRKGIQSIANIFIEGLNEV